MSTNGQSTTQRRADRATLADLVITGAHALQAHDDDNLDLTPEHRELLDTIIREVDRRTLTQSELATLRRSMSAAEGLPFREPIAVWIEREFLIPCSWLPAARAGILAGRGGAGKSRLALQLAYALVTGAPFLDSAGGIEYSDATGKAPDPCNVVVASWEDEEEEIGRRLQSFCADREVGSSIKGLTTVAMTDHLWHQPRGASVGELSDVGRMLQAGCEEREARLLVIDPVAAAYGGDDNSGPAVRAFMAQWDTWARESGCAVLFVIHQPKLRGKSPLGQDDAYAGSHQYQAAARFVWVLDRKEEPEDEKKVRGASDNEKDRYGHVLRCDKSSYGAPPDPVLIHMCGKRGRMGPHWRPLTMDAVTNRPDQFYETETMRRARLNDERHNGRFDQDAFDPWDEVPEEAL